MELARFQANPDHTTYLSVRSAVLATGQPGDLWPGLRPQVIQTLERQGRWGALVSLYLDEKEVGQALAALAEMERTPRASSYGYRFEGLASHYQAQVAEAAEEAYPNEALRLYKPVVQRLIDGRGRENYQQATGYLTRIKRLYQKQGQEAEWERYITNLRNSNKSLRVVIHVDPMQMLSLNKTCRYCPHCDLLIAHQDDVEHFLATFFCEQKPEVVGNDYLVLGTLDKPAWKQGTQQHMTLQEVLEALHDFKEVVTFKLTGGWVRDKTKLPEKP